MEYFHYVSLMSSKPTTTGATIWKYFRPSGFVFRDFSFQFSFDLIFFIFWKFEIAISVKRWFLTSIKAFAITFWYRTWCFTGKKLGEKGYTNKLYFQHREKPVKFFCHIRNVHFRYGNQTKSQLPLSWCGLQTRLVSSS